MSLALLAVLAACGTETSGTRSGGASTPAPVTGIRWNVGSVTVDGERTEFPDGPYFTLDAQGGITGSSGCNEFRGTATVSGSAITFGVLDSTKKMCPDSWAKLSDALFTVLEGRATYRGDGRTLTLVSENGASLDATAQSSGT